MTNQLREIDSPRHRPQVYKTLRLSAIHKILREHQSNQSNPSTSRQFPKTSTTIIQCRPQARKKRRHLSKTSHTKFSLVVYFRSLTSPVFLSPIANSRRHFPKRDILVLPQCGLGPTLLASPHPQYIPSPSSAHPPKRMERFVQTPLDCTGVYMGIQRIWPTWTQL